MLMQKLIEEAYESGADSLTLEVSAMNAPAVQMYEKFGFVVEGIRKGYYQRTGEDAYIMWKQGIKRDFERKKED